MNYSTIRIEGSIFSADILDKIKTGDKKGQLAKDFNLNQNIKVKDEIARAWADALSIWRVFKHRLERLKEGESGTTETRKFWIIPFLDFLGYDIDKSLAENLEGKSYAISHRAKNLDEFPVHIMGFKDSLDKKRLESGPRMSPHALVQEYINLKEEYLYALVTNGMQLRLLRDSSRLIKLSYIEFNLESMMEEEQFSDFAIMYRLIHSSRMPQKIDTGSESLIEAYHLDSLESGSRIREGLSDAVEKSIIALGNGFLTHPDNNELRDDLEKEEIRSSHYYSYLLKLIYRILFLMVVEERDLIYAKGAPQDIREIYYNYYSLRRIRKLCEKRYLADKKFNDFWINLKNTFKLFESEEYGKHLGIKPLAGDLFGSKAIGILNRSNLDNEVLMGCFYNLSIFINKKTGQNMRVNYASLNVEEFGSVYEGLLEYDPVVNREHGEWHFAFKAGTGRSTSGSHYTPDELVQPLIKNSLDHIIDDKLKEKDPEKALLSITVCDVACGSGHILLNAARRIGTELAKVRTKEDQPSPEPLRKAVRDVIGKCIYGVDKNPLAVELCKVALWLEAHNPGEPLNFLDHHIKCGDAIVGLAHVDELKNGIANEAFKSLPGDDKAVAQPLLKQNKEQKKEKLTYLNFDQTTRIPIEDIASIFKKIDDMPETNPNEVEKKRQDYTLLLSGAQFLRMRSLADIQVAQFFIPKTEDNMQYLITDAAYKKHFSGQALIDSGQAIKAKRVSREKRFFHWFLEFPEIFSKGGFDCILGNPPFLGGQKITGNFGTNYLEYLKYQYYPIGSVDLVTYFFRRIFTIIKVNGFQSLISTNTIAQGGAKEGGLQVIVNNGGIINHAIRSMKWPGLAAVEVALVTIFKGNWGKRLILDKKRVEHISPYLDDSVYLGELYQLKQNENKSFQGSIVLGKGFILTPDKAQELIRKNPKNKNVLFPYLNGQDLNNNIDQSPSRWVINFFDWSEEKAKLYPDCYSIIEDKVKAERRRWKKDKNGNEIIGTFALRKPLPEKWWIYAEKRPKLYSTITPLDRVLVVAQVSKTVAFTYVPKNQVISMMCIVLAFDKGTTFPIIQSSLHKEWVVKYGSALKNDTRYTPSDVFETFPFPINLSNKFDEMFEKNGEVYHDFRKQLMLNIKLGLTKTYNQFHNKKLQNNDEELPDKEFEKKYGKESLNLKKHLNKTEDTCTFNEAVEDIIKLRKLHKEMDKLVLEAYGWQKDGPDGEAIDLAHDFYEVDYLPENDRIRYTISPEARKEVLKRLLLLNHKIYEEEVKAGLHDKKTSKKAVPNKNKEPDAKQRSLFD